MKQRPHARSTPRAYEGGEAGDRIKNISSLVMLVYKGDNLYGRYVVVSDGPNLSTPTSPKSATSMTRTIASTSTKVSSLTAAPAK